MCDRTLGAPEDDATQTVGHVILKVRVYTHTWFPHVFYAGPNPVITAGEGYNDQDADQQSG